MYRERVHEMETRISHLERMLKISQMINSTLDQWALLDIIVQLATELTNTENASIMLIDETTGEMNFAAAAGQKSANIKPVIVPMEGSIAGTIARENKPLLIRDAPSDPRWFHDADKQSGFVTRSIMGVPMEVRGKVIGVVEALNKRDDSEMNWEDVQVLTALANQAAIAIENARMLDQLKTAYDDLSKLDQMKTDFISIAAHELRTPLSLILGYAMFLKSEVSGESQEQLDLVLQGAMRLRSLIDDMINLRQVDTGESVLELESFSLQSMVRETVEDMRPLAEAKGQKIILSLPQDAIVIEADRNKIALVVNNLLSNAIKFTDRQNRIGVQAGQNDDRAWFTIWDTGIGIPRSEMNHIFDRFYQIEPSIARHYEGMGLGLSIAQAMVELHHGRIQVKSQQGKGSAFTVYIPLKQNTV
ncbi:MAG: GAF domain-containing sensor histidine kinase [Anaerolineae bacterium]|nr:GAF domain-containing sensor histidine kinase [Anaerolineae bacterium]